MLISAEIYPFQSSVLQLTPACKALIAGASLEAGLAQRPGRDLATFWHALCFICGQEMRVRAVLPWSGLPAARRADRWAAGGQQDLTACSWVSRSILQLKDHFNYASVNNHQALPLSPWCLLPFLLLALKPSLLHNRGGKMCKCLFIQQMA